ncbi:MULTISPECIES: hypothetical protein [Bacillus cereus group]|uniref:Uncharacterized protein n=1 Tax=Bacillus thuringiensis serovar toumanoffi TaxID=180862 RepID=A0ABD5IAY2_BACTU|nr:hypothetical protein [Bacillus thuringiensis]EEM93127.1 hypothetical protein bthur0013_54760 [Bacillus thuringiensis IBL 200]MCR6784344.1 hypothetical protein [Bacillus thuringiensis]MCR6863123.1 hypothetical protein [Bacillus thuringiensis]MCR6869269.1 hypothetical protein [Bacillus thuringiensis]MDW9213980.1 hypothetical protein [Bacillus thuringiensis serovar toumanoffi]
MKYVEELKTDGWDILVGDIFTNGRMPYRLKVTQIEIENEQANPNDAKVYCVAVDLKNKNKLIKTVDVPDGDSNRAWYINEFWSK